MLIGPRTNTQGLFHGPLWSYINYPIYLLGSGNPIIVGWFWVFLGVVFLITSFLIAKKLFGMLPAIAYALLLAVRLPPHINRVFHSEATIFFVPLMFFTIYKYMETKKQRFLLLHLLSLVILIQLNIGDGFFFFVLSVITISFFIIRNKLWKHFLAGLTLPFFLINFILFDLRHNFQLAHAFLFTTTDAKLFSPLVSLLQNRIDNALTLHLLENTLGNIPLLKIIFVLVMIFSILHIKNNGKFKRLYILFFFYYFGYLFLSLSTKGVLLVHYVYLLIPLTALWLISFLEGKYKLIFLPFIFFIFFLNFQNSRQYIEGVKSRMGNDYNSWVSLKTVADEVVKKQNHKEFGYFVFAPDAYAYQPRYTMLYSFKANHMKAFEYVKKPTTYIIAAPPPANDPYMTYVWWRKNSVKISAKPTSVKKFPSGFVIEEFHLTPEEQKISHDKTIELGIHFR